MKVFAVLATMFLGAALLVSAVPCTIKDTYAHQECKISSVSSTKCCTEYSKYLSSKGQDFPLSCEFEDIDTIAKESEAGACHFSECGTNETCTRTVSGNGRVMVCSFPRVCSNCCTDYFNESKNPRCTVEDLEKLHEEEKTHCSEINPDCGTKETCTISGLGDDGSFSCSASGICSNCCDDLKASFEHQNQNAQPRCIQDENMKMFDKKACWSAKAQFALGAKEAKLAAGGMKTTEILLVACTGGLVGGALVSIVLVLFRQRRDVSTYEVMLG